MSALVAQMVKNLSAMWETQVWSLGQEEPQEKEMATHSSILAWKIPQTEEPDGLQSMGSQRVRHDWGTEHAHMHPPHRNKEVEDRKIKWPTPNPSVFNLKRKNKDIKNWGRTRWRKSRWTWSTSLSMDTSEIYLQKQKCMQNTSWEWTGVPDQRKRLSRSMQNSVGRRN